MVECDIIWNVGWSFLICMLSSVSEQLCPLKYCNVVSSHSVAVSFTQKFYSIATSNTQDTHTQAITNMETLWAFASQRQGNVTRSCCHSKAFSFSSGVFVNIGQSISATGPGVKQAVREARAKLVHPALWDGCLREAARNQQSVNLLYCRPLAAATNNLLPWWWHGQGAGPKIPHCNKKQNPSNSNSLEIWGETKDFPFPSI